MMLFLLSSLSLIVVHQVAGTMRKQDTWRYDAERKLCVLGNDVAIQKLNQVSVQHEMQKCIFQQCTKQGVRPYLRRNRALEACWDHLAKRCRRVDSEFEFINEVTRECGKLRCTALTSLEEVYVACYDPKNKECVEVGKDREIKNEKGECAVRRCQQLEPTRFSWSDKIKDCKQEENEENEEKKEVDIEK